MAGLVPAIHAFGRCKDVDARDKRGHDGNYVHSGFTPANFTTLPHFSVSAAMN
jgi:hypothetical protein